MDTPPDPRLEQALDEMGIKDEARRDLARVFFGALLAAQSEQLPRP